MKKIVLLSLVATVLASQAAYGLTADTVKQMECAKSCVCKADKCVCTECKCVGSSKPAPKPKANPNKPIVRSDCGCAR